MDKVHDRFPEKFRHKKIGRFIENGLRLIVLLHDPAFQYQRPRAKRQRFHRIARGIKHRRRGTLSELGDRSAVGGVLDLGERDPAAAERLGHRRRAVIAGRDQGPAAGADLGVESREERVELFVEAHRHVPRFP